MNSLFHSSDNSYDIYIVQYNEFNCVKLLSLYLQTGKNSELSGLMFAGSVLNGWTFQILKKSYVYSRKNPLKSLYKRYIFLCYIVKAFPGIKTIFFLFSILMFTCQDNESGKKLIKTILFSQFTVKDKTFMLI